MDDDSADADRPLTEYPELHGCSCKVGQGDLEGILEEVALYDPNDALLFGVGEDASARRIGDSLALVSTIDFFTPIIDDPYDFGRVAAYNAASDAFATGAIDDLNALVTLGLPREVTDRAADILAGIVDAIEAMGGVVAGGHTILNPWPFAGAAVTATAPEEVLMTSQGAEPGDRLYLTKPLGTQPAMGALRVKDGEFAATVGAASDRSIEAIADDAVGWMTTPNLHAAREARAVATAATDVTGFGLIGQAELLAERSGVGVDITDVPVISGTVDLSRLFGYGLEAGESAETSGGLLLTVPESETGDLENAFESEGIFYRAIGRITDGEGATIDEPAIEDVSR